jgi:uncharacterized protein with ATP-grasp and redox domains
MAKATKIATRAECIVCILEDVYTASETIMLNESQKKQIVEETLSLLHKELKDDRVPSSYITAAHRILKNISHQEDPFKEQKRICNDAGLRVAEQVDQQLNTVKGRYKRFRYLAKWAIAGNLIDIRTAGTSYELASSDLQEGLIEASKEELAIDDLEKIYDVVTGSKRILYILDNVGEIALDRLLIRELRTYGSYVTVAARGGPMTSDATVEDLSYVGLDKASDKVIITGADTLGLIMSEASKEFLEEAMKAEVIIGKGQANFYTLSTYRSQFKNKVISLFRTKCDCISSIFGKKGKIGIATLIENK